MNVARYSQSELEATYSSLPLLSGLVVSSRRARQKGWVVSGTLQHQVFKVLDVWDWFLCIDKAYEGMQTCFSRVCTGLYVSSDTV